MLQIGAMQAQNQRLMSHCNALERQKSMLLSQVGQGAIPCPAPQSFLDDTHAMALAPSNVRHANMWLFACRCTL